MEIFFDRLLNEYENSLKRNTSNFVRPQVQINKIKEASIHLAARSSFTNDG